MTRIRPLLALLTLALLTVGLIACGGGDEKSAAETLKAASKKEVKSGTLDVKLQARLDGVPQLSGPVNLSMKGPFESHGDKQFPSLDWKITASGAGQSVNAGLILVPDNAFIEYGGTTYEAGEDVVKRLLKQAQANQQDQADLKKLGVNPTDWLAEGEVEDGEEIDGVATDKVRGRLDVEKMLNDFNKIIEQPEFRKQLQPGQSVPKITQEQIDEVKKSVKNPTFTVNVGKDDSIIRRLAANVNFTIPQEQQSQLNGFKGGRISFTTTITDVGQKPDIKAPSGARPLSELLQSLGVPPSALEGAGALGRQGG
ncbi:MAG TPA: hypothetical protein VEG34_03930 [Thermoanaerobaculia bacterium]|nr:hypothetical protein [Thermoanaerobaculia bacterium]